MNEKSAVLGVGFGGMDCHDGRIGAKVFGAVQVNRGDQVLGGQQLGGPKARQILEILLLHLGSAVSKGALIDMLWRDSAPSTAVSTLESYVSVLRRRLQPGEGKRGVLRTTTGGYLLDGDLVDLDLAHFNSLLSSAEQTGGMCAVELLRQAISMSAEPLLGNGFLPEWAEAERCLHASRVTAARVRAAEIALQLGQLSDAVVMAQQVVDLDPLNEPAWSVLILSMERMGQPLRGLQALDQCRRIMNNELGCQPGEILQQAQTRMLRETSSADDDFSLVIRALLRLEGSSDAPGFAPGLGSANLRDGGDFTLREAGSIVVGYVRRVMTQAVA